MCLSLRAFCILFHSEGKLCLPSSPLSMSLCSWALGFSAPTPTMPVLGRRSHHKLGGDGPQTTGEPCSSLTFFFLSLLPNHSHWRSTPGMFSWETIISWERERYLLTVGSWLDLKSQNFVILGAGTHSWAMIVSCCTLMISVIITYIRKCPLWLWWSRVQTRPLHNHVWTQIQPELVQPQ